MADRPGGTGVRQRTGVGTDLDEALVRAGRYLRRGVVSADLRTLEKTGGREADSFYRDRWSYGKVVRSTHGVNCTGSCSWKVYVKDGIITWEAQQTDYPSVGPDRPEYEPRGCPRGAAYWRYRYDKFGWTTRSSQLYERRLLRLGSPMFHFGILLVALGHIGGLLIPEAWT